MHILTTLAVVLMVTGSVQVTWLWCTFIGWILIVGLGTAIGFHKLLSHQTFATGRWVKRILTYFGCLGLTGAPLYYVSIHQGYHHPLSDLKGDLHSPRDGFFHSYVGWQLKIRAKDIDLRTGMRILRDPWICWINQNYLKVSWGTFFILAAIDYRVALYGMIVPAFIGYHIENIVTSFGHKRWFGYRNYELGDDSVNNWLLGLLSWGNGLQNNHHQAPRRYNYRHKWFEVDLSVPIIAVLRRIP